MKKKQCIAIGITGLCALLLLFAYLYVHFSPCAGSLKDIREYNECFPRQQIPDFATLGELYFVEDRSMFHRHDIVIFGELDKGLLSPEGISVLSVWVEEQPMPGIQEIVSFPRCTARIFEKIRLYFDIRLDEDDFYIPMSSNYLRGHLENTSLSLHQQMVISRKTNKFILWIYEF